MPSLGIGLRHVFDTANPQLAAALGKTHRLTKALLPRSSSTCVGQGCPTGKDWTGLIVGLCAAIPIVTCFIALVYLHRRHVRKQRLEDANDEHGSLDFGLGSPGKKSGKAGGPEMAMVSSEQQLGRHRGLSLDIGSPYVIPATLQASRESIHSMARSMRDSNDPYRPVAFLRDDAASVRSSGPMKPDSLSTHTSTGMPFNASSANLLTNAQRLPTSTPPTKSAATSSSDLHQTQLAEPVPSLLRKAIAPARNVAPMVTEAAPTSPVEDERSMSRQNYSRPRSVTRSREQTSSPAALSSGTQSPSIPQSPTLPARGDLDGASSPPTRAPPEIISIPRVRSMEASMHVAKPSSTVTQAPNGTASASQLRSTEASIDDKVRNLVAQVPRETNSRLHSMEPSIFIAKSSSMTSESDYGDAVNTSLPVHGLGIASHPEREDRQTLEGLMPIISENEQPAGRGFKGLDFDFHRLSVGMRPLPPNDPNDNPEQRANRIRSFYKEYFDESKNTPAAQPPRGEYYEDYGQEYLHDAPVFDPATGSFAIGAKPFAQPVTRRAMTPPPRVAPRFRTAHRAPSHDMPPRARRFSSTSNTSGTGPQGRASGPRKPMPPPAALRTLPTPHMLKDDSMVFSPIDFAPPASYRDRQAGRQDSSSSERRSYSPSVRAHTPLASPFVDLPSLPSPHALRQSGSFTGLDFAPVPRFRTSEVNSDSGSVRSTGSGMTQAQLHSMRAGAYRVSRIPKEYVGTRDDIAVALRPTWALRS